MRKLFRRLRSELAECWRKALPELPAARVDAAARLATVALRGLALEVAVEGARVSKRDELETLTASVRELLEMGEG